MYDDFAILFITLLSFFLSYIYNSLFEIHSDWNVMLILPILKATLDAFLKANKKCNVDAKRH